MNIPNIFRNKILFIFFITITVSKSIELPKCNISESLKNEIKSYEKIANTLINELVNGDSKGTTYNHLEDFIDVFGARLTGSINLENSIDYMLNKSTQIDLDNVRGETVTVPNWIRGDESATLIQPRNQKLSMLGLGLSVGTSKDGITAEAVIFNSFDEMKNNSNKVPGKIVVFNQEYINYGQSVVYRTKGAIEASRLGAIAVLVRSVTPFSMNTPHTGVAFYDENVKKIPTACITVEDAKMLKRMYNKGETIVVNLKMGAQNLPNTESRNAIAELQGTEKPDSVVVVSGHIDSWDVGHGAMDDGGGMMISWNTLAVLKKLGLRPKRTIRAILWTAEEQAAIGSYGYYIQHKHEADKFNFMMESDMGTFEPIGFGFSGNDEAICIFNEILKLLTPINVTKITERPLDGGPDIDVWTENENVPGASLTTKNDKYFWYHHTDADKLDVLSSEHLDLCTAAWSVVSYVIADLSIDMPR